MGIAELFKEDDRIEITVSQLFKVLKEAAKADLFRNGVKNRVPYAQILQVMDGSDEALVKDDSLDEPMWHDAKKDPPKRTGIYYGKKDNTNSMWLCNYMDGKWTLSDVIPPQEIDIIQWAEYTAFSSDES